MRKFLAILLCSCTLGATAQTATSILDATAEKIKASGDVKVEFTATQFNGTTEKSRTSGSMCLNEKKLQLTTPELMVWYDGKTQWSYIRESGEVDISTPSKKEMACINPYTFLGMYKKGFRSSFRKSTMRGKQTYEVHLVAKYKKLEAQEIYVDVDQADYTLLCIRVRQGETWTRIALTDFLANQQFDDAAFTFNAADYPNVQIIDLR